MDSLKLFDAHPKLEEEAIHRSAVGGIVSVVAYAFMAFLFVSETYHFFHTDISSEVTVDRSVSPTLRVNIDVSLPSLDCHEFGLDATDVAGMMQLEIEGEDLVKKAPLVKNRWSWKKVGCRAYGHFDIDRVKGDWHIAFGRESIATNDPGIMRQQHIHRFSPMEFFTFNASHVINHLSFGDDFPGAVYPLDGVAKMVPEGTMQFQYHIQIVPTIYEDVNGKLIHTNQFSMTEHNIPVVRTPTGFKQPGIFFNYDIAPYAVIYKEKQHSFTHFFTSLCALVGGTYVVGGFLSSLAEKVVRRKDEHGVTDERSHRELPATMHRRGQAEIDE